MKIVIQSSLKIFVSDSQPHTTESAMPWDNDITTHSLCIIQHFVIWARHNVILGPIYTFISVLYNAIPALITLLWPQA